FLNLVIDFLPATHPAGGIAIDPNHFMIRKKFIQMFFDLASAHTQCDQFLMLTLRTVLRHPVNGATVMAMQMLIRLAMHSKIGIAVRTRSEEHTSELQSRENLVCRLLLEKKKTRRYN